MFKTPLSEIRAPRPSRQQTTSTADTTSFLSEGKVRGAGVWGDGGGGGGGWDGALNPVDCLHKAFPCWLSCMCGRPFSPPPHPHCCFSLSLVSACVKKLPLVRRAACRLQESTYKGCNNIKILWYNIASVTNSQLFIAIFTKN